MLGGTRHAARGTWYVLVAVVAAALIFQLYPAAVRASVAMIISAAAVAPLADRLVDCPASAESASASG